MKTKNDAVSTSMALCDSLCEDIIDLKALLESNCCEELPYWWTNKLAISAAYVNGLRDYVKFYDMSEEDEDDSETEDSEMEDASESEMVDMPMEQDMEMMPPSARMMKNATKKG